MRLIGAWASARADEAATGLLCEALMGFGERSDLALLDALPKELRT
ncbi:MAG TPA: hypothetical protein VF641_03260 [Methylobacterium sp.]|jgi:hypothetical protein